MNAASNENPRLPALLSATEQRLLELAGAPEGDLCAEMVRYHLQTPGRRLRARLAVEAVLAMGGSEAQAVAWGAACESMHNASLVHDDVQDGDAFRRHEPAVWSRYGVPQAINAGDLLLMMPFLAISDPAIPPERQALLSATIARHGAETVRGQAEELRLRENPLAGEGAYRRAAVGKTSGLFGLPIQGAALLCGRSMEEARSLAEPFERLGLLYQLQDDVIDCFGDKGRFEVGSDLREGKVSALTAAHLTLHPDDGPWLMAILASPRDETCAMKVENAIERLRTEGALARVLAQIDELADVEGASQLASEPTLRSIAAVLRDTFIAPLASARRLLRVA